MDAVNDFKSIRRKLERQEQKAEFEAKNRVLMLTDMITGKPYPAPENLGRDGLGRYTPLHLLYT